jgi:hypothetical protein
MTGFNPFASASPPSDVMIAYALVYMLVVFALALGWFARRDL